MRRKAMFYQKLLSRYFISDEYIDEVNERRGPRTSNL
jgi:hypothetical protein